MLLTICVFIWICAPKEKNVNGVCEKKMKKLIAKNEHDAQIGAELNFAHVNICIFLSN